MLPIQILSTVLVALGAHAFAATIPEGSLPLDGGLVKRQAATSTSTRVPDAACTNGPRTRNCWSSGFSIATDFDAKAPPAGKTVTYDLTITNTTLNPDGIERLAMLINGQYPGPTLVANWGDTLVVNVRNELQDNGTSIHWHGIRQLNSMQMDGANGVTECPIAPGETKQYRFRCTQFGTSWYHSHHSAQYGDGIVGTIIINGPATANYDEDLGVLPITDWFHETIFAMNWRALHSLRGPPIANNALINGVMKSPDGTRGRYHKMTVTKGKKYRLRIINTSIDTHWHVALDGHTFEVITSDFVPVKPWVTNELSVAIGQRYDVIIHANQTADNYWMRFGVGTACGRNANAANIRAILSYSGAPDSEPTTSGVTMATDCNDHVATPWVPNTVPRDQFDAAIKKLDMSFSPDQSNPNLPLVRWLINGSDIYVEWDKPTLEYLIEGNTSYPRRYNLYEFEGTDTTWTFWVMQTAPGQQVNLPHPIHLHGHDFYVLGSGSGQWDGSTTGLTFVNPPRRDTATMPAGGYLILAFPMDNPGAWLMHCHIAWHVGQGLSVQFLERKNEILGRIGDLSGFEQGCASWSDYWNGPHPYEQEDSGL